MLCCGEGSREWRLIPGPLRLGRNDSEADEVCLRNRLSWRSCYPRFPSVPPTVLRGWVHLFHSNNQELLVDVPDHVSYDDIPLAAVVAVEASPLVAREVPVNPVASVAQPADEHHPVAFREYFQDTEPIVRRTRRRGARAASGPAPAVPVVGERQQATRRSRRLEVKASNGASPDVGSPAIVPVVGPAEQSLDPATGEPEVPLVS
eukprot:IDg6814t1